MPRKTRRIIFYVLALVFLIAGPLLVAYSLGLTFNFSTAHFEQTGGIFIKSKTPRMSVFLDGALIKETGLFTGSTLLPDLAPGTHLVRLEKPDFRSWSKTIRVAPAEVTELRNIILVPRPLASATSSKEEVAEARASSTPTQVLTLDKKGRLVAGKGKNARVIIENVHSFSQTDDAIFFIDKNGFLARYVEPGGGITTIGRPGFFLNDTHLRFITGKQYLAVLDPSGGLFLFDENAATILPVTGGVRNVSFDSTEKKMLVQKEQSVSVFWLADNDRQPFQEKGKMEDVLFSPIPIRDAQWLYKTDAHVVYRTRDGIFLTEIDRRGGGNIVELVSGATDELLTLPSLPNAIFYRVGKTFFKIEL